MPTLWLWGIIRVGSIVVSFKDKVVWDAHSLVVGNYGVV